MAWVTPTNVATGDVLTAATWNQAVVENTITLPQGIIGIHTLTSGFSTSATHTTYQDEGLTASVTYGANRYLKVGLLLRPYPNGGLQAILYQVLRGSTVVATFVFESPTLATGTAGVVYVEQSFAGPATAGTETFKVQVKAGAANTQVTSYASSTDGVRQMIIEDCGAV